MSEQALKSRLEAVLMSSSKPLSIKQLMLVLSDEEHPVDPGALRQALDSLVADYQHRGVQLCQLASGFRFQVGREYSHWVRRLLEEKPPRYSRALLETLAIIAYRQPVTRAEIEDIRGVAVNSSIIRTLREREWIKVVGHRELPGRPELLATTRSFLDYFNLKKLAELPTLAELREHQGEAAEPGLETPDDDDEPATATLPAATGETEQQGEALAVEVMVDDVDDVDGAVAGDSVLQALDEAVARADMIVDAAQAGADRPVDGDTENT